MKALLAALMLLGCGSLPPPCPLPEVPDAGLLDGGQAWTECSSAAEGKRSCSVDNEVITCGRFRYSGQTAYVWTTAGEACP